MHTASQYLNVIFFPYTEWKLFQFKYLNKLVAFSHFLSQYQYTKMVSLRHQYCYIQRQIVQKWTSIY